VYVKPADEFPVDDSGYGFDNIGDVLTISPLLMEKYLRGPPPFAPGNLRRYASVETDRTGGFHAKEGAGRSHRYGEWDHPSVCERGGEKWRARHECSGLHVTNATGCHFGAA
jgi:hypothetical protein